MQEQMTKQDAIEYLLYLKHDVQAKSPMDIALDTAIEVLKQPTIEPEVRHGDWNTIYSFDGDVYFRCSNCEEEFVLDDGNPKSKGWKYCPSCGCKMDGGAEQ